MTFVVLLIMMQQVNAQFYKTILPSPEFNSALEKIVRDFRYNFENIAGEKISGNGEVENYQSNVQLPGAINCVINRYHSVYDTTASWQGILYEGEDYEEAKKVYKNTFRLLNKSKMQLIDRSVTGFSGELQTPTDNVRFTVSALQLDHFDPRYKRFTAEVELVSSYNGWLVKVNFFNKKPDTEF